MLFLGVYASHPYSNFYIFLNNNLEVSRQVNKTCAIMGDFNVNLTRYASYSKTSEFYDLMCSHSFRPLILQPTRVTDSEDFNRLNDITSHTLSVHLLTYLFNYLFTYLFTYLFNYLFIYLFINMLHKWFLNNGMLFNEAK